MIEKDIGVKKNIRGKELNRRECKGGAKKDKGREGGGKIEKNGEEKVEEKDKGKERKGKISRGKRCGRR